MGPQESYEPRAAGLLCRRLTAENAGKSRKQNEREHHREILDDEPADGDASALGLDQPPFLKSSQDDNRARHRQRKTEHDPGTSRPAEGRGNPEADQTDE